MIFSGNRNSSSSGESNENAKWYERLEWCPQHEHGSRVLSLYCCWVLWISQVWGPSGRQHHTQPSSWWIVSRTVYQRDKFILTIFSVWLFWSRSWCLWQYSSPTPYNSTYLSSFSIPSYSAGKQIVRSHSYQGVIWYCGSRVPPHHHLRAEYMLRIGLVLITFSLAAAVPKLDLFISLVGAVSR